MATMKIAVLADIHANLPALEAVTADLEAWRPDRVIVAGDVINRGPRSPECLDFILEKIETAGWQVLKGNHEDYVIAQAQLDSLRSGPLFDVYRHTRWTFDQLQGEVAAVETWPDFIHLETPDKSEIRVAHASMLGNTFGIFPMMDNGELSRRVGKPFPTLFCCGHTHYPLITQLNGTLVVNVGAAGLPFDGDRRGSYARFTWRVGEWESEIVRVVYDYTRTMADFQTSGFLHEAGPMTWLVLVEFLYAKSQLFAWMRDYYEPVLAGEMTVEAAVREQLEIQGLWEEIKTYV
ncbi:MAG TPA: metallophosphoesterase family protein [Anaerolineales bacterium]|nr:metallophosphoesterase family protein [Anaerolineales bacterium]